MCLSKVILRVKRFGKKLQLNSFSPIYSRICAFRCPKVVYDFWQWSQVYFCALDLRLDFCVLFLCLTFRFLLWSRWHPLRYCVGNSWIRNFSSTSDGLVNGLGSIVSWFSRGSNCLLVSSLMVVSLVSKSLSNPKIIFSLEQKSRKQHGKSFHQTSNGNVFSHFSLMWVVTNYNFVLNLKMFTLALLYTETSCMLNVVLSGRNFR